MADLRRCCAKNTNVWQDELFGICRRNVEDGVDEWLSGEEKLVNCGDVGDVFLCILLLYF